MKKAHKRCAPGFVCVRSAQTHTYICEKNTMQTIEYIIDGSQSVTTSHQNDVMLMLTPKHQMHIQIE